MGSLYALPCLCGTTTRTPAPSVNPRRKISRTWRMATLQLSLLASIPPAKAKERILRTASGGFRYPSPPGAIIPERWARINRNVGRQSIGTGGAIIPESGGGLLRNLQRHTRGQNRCPCPALHLPFLALCIGPIFRLRISPSVRCRTRPPLPGRMPPAPAVAPSRGQSAQSHRCCRISESSRASHGSDQNLPR